MKSETGIVTVVQEGRFRLLTPDGRTRLFMLAPDAGVEAQDLPALERDQSAVRVDYEDADALLAAIAIRIQELPEQRTIRT